jgi:hypothetical protein
MTLPERIRRAVSVSGLLDDDELAARLHVVRQQINQTARRMEARGELVRYVGPAGKIVNALPSTGEATTRRPTPESPRPAPSRPGSGQILLVTCVKTKASSPRAAKDLYTSTLFKLERAHAERAGVPWFILSAEHGLVAPDEWLDPYERYLPDTPASYREAWGQWVAARLELLVGDLSDKVVEVHASEGYIASLRRPMQTRGATIVDPLHGLSHGQRLAWYGAQNGDAEVIVTPTSVYGLVTVLGDGQAARSPAELLASGAEGLRVPGLYSWWVDEPGAADLTRGLGHAVRPGLVYAGLAGATKWPSGKASSNTLWGRITGMHLGGNCRMSTLRLTFGSILASADGWDAIDEHALTEWMRVHMRVVPVPFADADALGRMEKSVLEELNPPLNLQDVPKNDLRRELSRLRAVYTPRRTTTGDVGDKG